MMKPSKATIEIFIAPPSINSYVRYTNRGGYITPKGREFKEYVENYLLGAVHMGKITPLGDSRLKVEYEFHFKGKRKRDVDNYIKPLQDCLEGSVFDNDEQVDEINAKRFYHCEENKIVINIHELV